MESVLTAILAATESKNRELQDERFPTRANSGIHHREYVKLRWLVDEMLVPAAKIADGSQRNWKEYIRDVDEIRKHVNRVIRGFKKPGSGRSTTYADGFHVARSRSEELIRLMEGARKRLRKREPKGMQWQVLATAKRKTELFEKIDRHG